GIEFWERSGRTATRDEVLGWYFSEYDRLIAEDREQWPNPGDWLTGGRVKTGDDIHRRRQRGADMIDGYVAYADVAVEQGWEMAPEEPACEVEFSLDLDGVQVVGFIDQIIEWPGGRLAPRDLKSGTKRPDWEIQLGVYALAIQDMYGVQPWAGDFFMLKDG